MRMMCAHRTHILGARAFNADARRAIGRATAGVVDDQLSKKFRSSPFAGAAAGAADAPVAAAPAAAVVPIAAARSRAIVAASIGTRPCERSSTRDGISSNRALAMRMFAAVLSLGSKCVLRQPPLALSIASMTACCERTMPARSSASCSLVIYMMDPCVIQESE